jgi:hypothetical protein
MDPLKTTWAYSNNLYSMEFFKLAQSHLNKGGILFVNINGKEVMAKNLISVFEHVRSYDFGFFASDAPFTKTDFNVERFLSGFSERDRDVITNIYGRINFIGEKPFLEQKTAGYPVNRDMNPIMEYYLGLQVKEKFLCFK